MSDQNYNQVFVVPDGTELKVLDSYRGRYLQQPIQRIYQKPEHQSENALMEDKWKGIDCKKIEVYRHYVDRDTMEKRPAVETMVIAENKNWVEYPLAKSYTAEYACNCEYYTKVEVVLMDEKYSRRLFFDWKGKSFVFNFMKNCATEILESILEDPDKYYAKVENENDQNPIIYLEFYSDNGELVQLELEGEREIERRIASIRVVEFIENRID